MRKTFLILTILFCVGFAAAQNEQAPIQEKDVVYKDWSYKDIRTGSELNLRNFAKGKKLVLVAYFAPWCLNWKHDAPILERLHQRYQADGLGIIAVGEYDPVPAMKANLDALKVTFPAVYESENRGDRQKTLHYSYRRATGDARGWGSPWYIFLRPSTLEKSGEVLVRTTSIINGEIIEVEGDAFIRKHLGLSGTSKTVEPSGKIEVCDPASKIALTKP